MNDNFKRVNILIGEAQYERIQKAGLNLSGLIRDLIQDHFSDRQVVLSVQPPTRQLYDQAISNFGATDSDLEQCLVKALDELLKTKAEEIGKVRASLRKKQGGAGK